MKYANAKASKATGISVKTMKALEKIAMDTSYALDARGGIEARFNDSEDFIEESIYSIQKMLEKAYLLGKSEAQ